MLIVCNFRPLLFRKHSCLEANCRGHRGNSCLAFAKLRVELPTIRDCASTDGIAESRIALRFQYARHALHPYALSSESSDACVIPRNAHGMEAQDFGHNERK